MRTTRTGPAVIALLMLTTAGCAATTDPYPMPPMPPHAWTTSPAEPGVPRRTILVYVDVRPGDRIEFLGAEALGDLDGASVRFLLARTTIEADGTHLIGARYEALEGAVAIGDAASGADNTVGVGAELTAGRPGTYEITNVRLRYRLNGAERSGEGITTPWTVCAASPAPAHCEAPSSEP